MALVELAIDDPSETNPAGALLGSESVAQGKSVVRITGNARSAGFISKPGRMEALKSCMEGPLIGILQRTPGFAGAILLHAQKESRNLWILTFWETEEQAANSCWEEFSAVRQLLSPLIDVCTKVQTFRATLPHLTEKHLRGKAAAVC